MKTVMKIVLALALLIGGCTGVVFWATSGLPKAADAFFTAIAKQDYPAAIQLTTADFQASTSAEQLQAFAEENGLTGYREASWSSRSIENDTGALEGTLTLADGGSIPVTVQLVKGADGWRVQNVSKANAGVQEN